MRYILVDHTLDFETAEDFYFALVVTEGAALGCATGFRLWDHVPHNLLAFLAAAAVHLAYVLLVKRAPFVYWMLPPRLLMWGWAATKGLKFVDWLFTDIHLDLVWQAFIVAVVVALIAWNAWATKKEFAEGRQTGRNYT